MEKHPNYETRVYRVIFIPPLPQITKTIKTTSETLTKCKQHQKQCLKSHCKSLDLQNDIKDDKLGLLWNILAKENNNELINK